MLPPDGQAVLEALDRVARERRARADDGDLARRVEALKRYQHERFARTYADLASGAPDARGGYAPAARFFLDELYGPHDFADRDAQFARVVPGLTRLFAPEIVATVRELAELHALSESLDTAMARALPHAAAVDAAAYVAAWQAVGRREARQRQVELMLAVGSALDRYTRNPVLRHGLRMMRMPARAAGLGALQSFLERGFDTFRAIGGAKEFLALVAARETALIDALFAADPGAPAAQGGPLQRLP